MENTTKADSNTTSELLASFDVVDRRFETEQAYVSLFVELKSRGAFNRKRQVAIKVGVHDYVAAAYLSAYNTRPPRIIFGDYEMLLDC